MKPTRLRCFAGLISIAWMVGIHALVNNASENFILFRFDYSAFSTQFTYLGMWLGVGLLFSIAGLRCGKSAGQVCAIVAVAVFIYYAWRLYYPSEVPSVA